MKTIMWFGFVLGALSAAAKVIFTKPGQSATIECAINTFTNSLEWRHGSDLIISMRKSGFPRKGPGDIVGRSRVRQEMNLEISRVKEEDAGKFTCVADGKSEEHTLLVVSVSASPSSDLQVGSEATLQCEVKGLNPDSIVQWSRAHGSALIKSETVQLKSVASSDAGTWKCTITHDGMTYNESLDIKVKEPAPKTPAPLPSQSSNDVPYPTCLNCVTDPSSDAALLLGLKWWVWVAVGVGCLVMVLLLVFVIVLCKRIRRRKRKLQMKNGYQLPKPKQYCQCNRPTAAAKPQQGRRREKPSAPPLQPLLME